MDKPGIMQFFDEPSKEETAAKDAFEESMKALSDHCSVAKDMFAQVASIDSSLNLGVLCEFGGDKAGQGVLDTVDKRKSDVRAELVDFKSNWNNFEVTDVEETNEVSEPHLLKE